MSASRLLTLTLMFALAGSAVATPVSLRDAVDRALKNSNAIRIAQADLARSKAGLREAHDAYIPPVYLGSGLAYTNGFPLGEPEVFNLTSQSMLYNPAQRENIRAAKADLSATQFSADDTRRQIILDTATSYAELQKVTASLEVLKEQIESATRMEELVHKRVEAGIDTQTENTRAHLSNARIQLKQRELQSTAELLRQHLSQLTGLPADTIETDPETIPAFPVVDQSANLGQKAIDNSLVIKAADDQAKAKELRAKGEHKQNSPTVDFVAQYALFDTTINNYNNYYVRPLPRNNMAAGVQIKFPLFNPTQRAHADGADAIAERARAETTDLRNQISSETLRLQRLVAQYQDVLKVAQLEYQLAQSDLEALKIKSEATSLGPDQSGRTDVTPKDLETAHIAVAEKYTAVIDAAFELDRAQLQLMRQTGEIETWALSPQP